MSCIDVPEIDAAEFHRQHVRKMARIAFEAGTDRRKARRARWCKQGIDAKRKEDKADRIRGIVADYLAGMICILIAKKYKVDPATVFKVIAANVTAKQRDARKKMLKNAAMLRCDDRAKPQRKRRAHKTPVLGYESLSEAARANGIRPGTLWMQIQRKGKAALAELAA